MPSLEEVDMGYQVPVVPQLLIDGEIRATFLTLSQVMTSQVYVVISQVQAMTS